MSFSDSIKKLSIKVIYLIKLLISSFLLGISIYALIIGIKYGCSMTSISVVIDSLILIFSLTILFLNEGFQVAALKIQHMSYLNDFEEHARTKKIHDCLYPNGKENAMKRLFIGQSFLVVLCSFIIAQLTTFKNFPLEYSMQSKDLSIFLSSGFPGIFCTVCLAQLFPSLLAKQYPKQFLNFPGVYSLIRFALIIESIGIVYFLNLLVSIGENVLKNLDKKENRKAIVEKVKTRKTKQNEIITMKELSKDDLVSLFESYKVNTQFIEVIKKNDITGQDLIFLHSPESVYSKFDLLLSYKDLKLISDKIEALKTNGVNYFELELAKRQTNKGDSTVLKVIKYIISSALTFSSLGFVLYCLSMNYSSFGAPVSAQCIIIVVALVVIFYCEGMKIAIVSNERKVYEHIPEDEIPEISQDEIVDTDRAKIDCKAGKIMKLLSHESDGVGKYLLGRQQIVVPLGFTVAQITHFGGLPIGSLPIGIYFLLVGFGLPTVLILLQFSQLTPQILAESHGEAFLSLPGAYSLVYIALAIEKLGITCISSFLIEIISKLSDDKRGKLLVTQEEENIASTGTQNISASYYV